MTSETTTCRDINELLPSARLAVQLLFQECYKAGIRNIFITETYRSQGRQKYLYAQGRTLPGQIVTWTLNSNHKSRLAWDVAVGPPQSLYDVTTLSKMAAIARKLTLPGAVIGQGTLIVLTLKLNHLGRFRKATSLKGI